ncbi:MAG: hypothetical protein HY774_25785 [Acidobacteria bacterium]|nr:hypothetical protein [Acidobacteriota bacterium]
MAEQKWLNNTSVKLCLFVIAGALTFCLVPITQKLHSLYSQCNLNDLQIQRALKRLQVDQMNYLNGKGNGKFSSQFMDLVPPSPSEDHFYFSRVYTTMSKSHFCGYILGPMKLTEKTDSQPATFSVIAYPAKPRGFLGTKFFQSGSDCYYIDQTGVLRHSGSPTLLPDANSPPVEYPDL